MKLKMLIGICQLMAMITAATAAAPGNDEVGDADNVYMCVL